MAEPLKNIFFTEESVEKMADAFQQCCSSFDKKKFTVLIFAKDWRDMALKERMHHATECLHQVLPPSFDEALMVLKEAAHLVKGFEALCLPEYVAKYGMEHWDLALPALKFFTPFLSSEMAIRPFLAKNPVKVMPYMLQWAEDENAHVRRLASEGCRPRLPWAMALPKFKADPTPILPVLEKLKDDPSEYVRRSVANNLNDISKDHPQLVLEVCEGWFGKSENTDKIIKHALRTLLKKGNKRAMILFGFADPKDIIVNNLTLKEKRIAIGGELHFNVEIINQSKNTKKVRLEYAIDYMKAHGRSSRKVFQLIERDMEAGTLHLKRKHSMANMSTRTHYPGRHTLTIIVNGDKKAQATFDLFPQPH